MTELTLIVGQSGGATAVTNATLAGVVRQAQQAGFSRILGMQFGLQGLLQGEFHDLSGLSMRSLDRLAATPSAALGTSRLKMSDNDIEIAAHNLANLGCQDVVLIGGNDSADTALRLHKFDAGLRVVLAPKTVDNDLPGTDHCPGYPSAAGYFASIVRNATFDTLASPSLYPVKLIDAMGRDAGWLAAAATLAFGEDEIDLHPLLVLPERPPEDADEILTLIEHRLNDRGWVVCVLPETMRDRHGRHLSGDAPDYVDPFGHPYQMPPAVTLAATLSTRLGIQARFERPGSAVRMTQTSLVDRNEALRVGEAAVERLQRGESGIMVSIERTPGDDYHTTCGAVDLEEVANLVRPLDERFIGVDNHSVTADFRDYGTTIAWSGALSRILAVATCDDHSQLNGAGE